MSNSKEIVLERVNLKWLSNFLPLSGLAIGLPFFIHSQLITGPIINAILIIALLVTGLRSALLISFLPSMIAFGSGLLPITLAPAIPFIIASNILFVLVISIINKIYKNGKNAYWLSVLPAVLVKFIFLVICLNLISSIFASSNSLEIVTKMMGYMQLVTALAGAIIAYLILKFIIWKKYV